jgi:hypothetical protein
VPAHTQTCELSSTSDSVARRFVSRVAYLLHFHFAVFFFAVVVACVSLLRGNP